MLKKIYFKIIGIAFKIKNNILRFEMNLFKEKQSKWRKINTFHLSFSNPRKTWLLIFNMYIYLELRFLEIWTIRWNEI